MFDFNVLKFFGINTRSGNVLSPLPIRWEFFSLGWVKINTDGVARVLLVLRLVVVFFMGV